MTFLHILVLVPTAKRTCKLCPTD